MLANIERPASEILIFDMRVFAIKFPQFKKISWKVEAKSGKIISFNPIIPEPIPTQAESIDKASPKNKDSFISILLEWSES